jgi:membrane fusion protein, multidrug efflux system
VSIHVEAFMRVLIHQPWKAWGVIAALGVVMAALWPSATSVAQSSKAEPASGAKPAPVVPVKVAKVVRQDQTLSLQAVGQVQAARQAVVRARIEGLLTEVGFTEGQAVRQGQVLARLDDRSLRAQVAQAEGELKRLQSQLDLARLELQRAQSLLKESAVSTQQRDQQLALVAQLQAQVQAQQASLSQSQTQLSYTVITAPFAGRVGLRQVDVGNVVRPTDAQGLVTLVQSQPLMVVFSVPQSRLGDVRQALSRAQGAPVAVAEREGGPVLAQGQLRASDAAVDAGSGTLRLKAELAPSGERLWPGQFVTVRLDTGALEGALSVPTRAVQRGLKGSFVWRVAQGQAQVVPVQVLWQSDAVTVIDAKPAPEGLQPGDQVVVDGHSRLKPKANVKLLGA